MISSPVPALNKLIIRKTPRTRVLRGYTMVKIGPSSWIMEKDGKVYSDYLQGKAYCLGNWPWMKQVLDFLVSVGIITKGEKQIHMDAVAEFSEKRKKVVNAQALERALEATGCKPSAAQRKFIESTKPKKRRKMRKTK